MSMDADSLLDRLRLKRQLRFWKFLTVVAVIGALAAVGGGVAPMPAAIEGSYIARYNVEGVITDDIDRDELFKKTANNSRIKAVIVEIDSPGGTAVGGERLYKTLKKMSDKKPVVAVMKTMATSAAYMAVLGTQQVFAQEGTITGSIGVIMQMMELTEMAKKVGIEPVSFKSAPLKASPSPFEKVTPEAAKAAQELVDSFYGYFTNLVKKHRNLDKNTLALVSNGRVFTGAQALELRLVDAIGSEEEAIAWLVEKHGIDGSLPVKEIEVEREPEQWMREAFGSIAGVFAPMNATNSGLIALWQPER